MPVTTLEELLVEQVRDLYDAENLTRQCHKHPKMI